MFSITARQALLQAVAALASLLWGALTITAEPKDRKEAISSPTVKWLPEPTGVADSTAETETQMKPYAELITGTDVKFDMVPIPGGKFLMGSPKEEPKRKVDENPQHEVEIEPFWMGKYEVTWDEFELWNVGLDQAARKIKKIESTPRDRLADAISAPTRPCTDLSLGMGKQKFPAISMSHICAKIYCKWLSIKTGRYYRLPTEAEWEYACRAGATTVYSFGDDSAKLDDYGWFFDNSDDKYHKVGQKKPNPWGLYDMHGNVAEWVLDAHSPDGYEANAAKAPSNPLVEPTRRYGRVTRGGSWTHDACDLRSAARQPSVKEWMWQDRMNPSDIWYLDAPFIGFRIVRPLRKPTEEECGRFELTKGDLELLAEWTKTRTAPSSKP